MGFLDNLRSDTYRPIGGGEVAHKDDPRAFTGAALLAQMTFYCPPAEQRRIEQIYLSQGDRGGLAALEAAGQAMYAELQRKHQRSYDACDRMVEQEAVVHAANEELKKAIVDRKWSLPRLQHEAVKARKELEKRNQLRLRLRPEAIAEEKMVGWLQERREGYVRDSRPWDQVYSENVWAVKREWKKYREAEARRLETEGRAANAEQKAVGLILPDLDKRILDSGQLDKEDRIKLAREMLATSRQYRHGLVHMVFEPAASRLKKQNLILAS